MVLLRYAEDSHNLLAEGLSIDSGMIIVESEANYKKWLDAQKSEYYTLFPEKNPVKPAIDTAKVLVAGVMNK